MNPSTQPLVTRASLLTVGELLRVQARLRPHALAVADDAGQWTFSAFNERVNRLAHVLSAHKIGRGDRIGILSENRHEYLELAFAAAKLGAIFCALNWRLSAIELLHCIRLATPKAVIVSPRFAAALAATGHEIERVIELGVPYEDLLSRAATAEPEIAAHPEDGLVIIYTSGTTGMPKGALISHRTELARMQVHCIDLDLTAGDSFVAWPPMFHMVATEQAIQVMCLGGKVIIVDGFDADRLADLAVTERQWWLVMMPGMIDAMMQAMKKRNAKPAGIKMIGAMADLVPRHQLAELTALFNAPYANTFGATETGLPPASAGLVPIGVVAQSLSKKQSAMCDLKLVDADDNEVGIGKPGEAAVRGPTVFSGYWNAPEVNARDFRGGWFHMGDVFVRKPDGGLDFVDRVKYMIKSGGENIYPAEIEQVLLADPRIDDAVVVRKRDNHWGEVPVAFVVARKGAPVSAEDLLARCQGVLARYKVPKAISFVAIEDLPRSTTGKIQRHEVEKWLEAGAPGTPGRQEKAGA